MLAYYGTDISPNQTETAEGFLICRNVPVARTGMQDYLARELNLDGDPESIVTVNRHPEDVFELATLASFEGKPVTDGHPPESVSPENFSNYARGHMQNVRRDGDYIVADLFINDPILASEVKNGIKREVSCGYLCQYEPDGASYKQTKIRGNHVAVVPKGRAGATVAIKDAAEQITAAEKKGMTAMSKLWQGVLTAFAHAAKDAKPEEIEQMAETAATVLEAAPVETKTQDAEPAATDEVVYKEQKGVDLGTKIDAILEKIASLEKRLDEREQPEEKMSDETSIDELIGKLGGEPTTEETEKAMTVPADEIQDKCGMGKDAAIAWLKALRPAVAAIEDKATRAAMTDAILKNFSDKNNTMSNILSATTADRAAQFARTSQEEKIKAQQEAYDARNPHKAKKEDK